MVGDWLHSEQVANAESQPNYRAHPIGWRRVSRVCGLFDHLRGGSDAGDVVGEAGTGATPSYELVDIDSHWEAAADGLFSAPLVADRFTTGSKSATISEQVVGRDSAITVPYAGRIPVAGADDQSRADHRRTCAPRQGHPAASISCKRNVR
jgi:protein involved in polysaccharide export with SLBB domain